ncbi:MAG: DUF393 domain-containing protein [Nitrospira sp.]
MPNSQPGSKPCLLIYDGHCRLCVAAKNGLDRAGVGAKVRFVPYESEDAVLALGEGYRPGPPTMAYLVSPSGAIAEGLGAFLPLAVGLPGGKALTALLRWGPAKGLAECLYRWIARHRYRLFGAANSPAD